MSDKNLSIPFKLVNIEEKQFSVFEEVLKLEKPIQEKVSTGFGVDVESRVIGSSVEYMLLKEDKPMLHIEVVCYFEIEEKAFNKKLVRADKLVLPIGFAKHLAMVTTGTTRGVLYANTHNTDFKDYFMRMIDVDKILEDKDITLNR